MSSYNLPVPREFLAYAARQEETLAMCSSRRAFPLLKQMKTVGGPTPITGFFSRRPIGQLSCNLTNVAHSVELPTPQANGINNL